MSADNWLVCPKCKRQAEKEREQAIASAQSRYGKVAEPAYRQMITRAEKQIALAETFREDYQIGMSSDAFFEVSYYGRCTACNFEHSYKYEAKVNTWLT